MNTDQVLKLLCAELPIVTEIDTIGPDTEMGSIGIDVLMATDVAHKLQQELNVEIIPFQFFQAESPRDQISQICIDEGENIDDVDRRRHFVAMPWGPLPCGANQLPATNDMFEGGVERGNNSSTIRPLQDDDAADASSVDLTASQRVMSICDRKMDAATEALLTCSLAHDGRVSQAE
eukprot:1196588-Rhodomonas_salina.6